ncbi:MAG TPA: DUF3159 domain-containing protein [Micromonosporaceae bacterium]|nr:DUF3159 domain-containing protein [Micromonosporaceae bacterium]
MIDEQRSAGSDRHSAAAEEEPWPTLSEQLAEQLGGARGLAESSIPVGVFIVVNLVWSLYPAIYAAVGMAVGIGAFRLFRRQPVRHAVNGLLGIAVGAWLAYRSGEARDFYLPGIWLAMGQAVLLFGSVAVRRPIIGYAWAILSAGGRHDWLHDPRLHRTFQWLTVAWGVSLVVRGGVQWALWAAGQADWLGIARIGLSWPIYLGMLAITVWMVRRTIRTAPVVPA